MAMALASPELDFLENMLSLRLAVDAAFNHVRPQGVGNEDNEMHRVHIPYIQYECIQEMV